MRNYFYLIVIAIAAIFIFNLYVSQQHEVVYKCKVIDLQQQQKITGNNGNMSTEYRYIVITDKETFICESSLFNGKFNNSDIFYNLHKDSTYTLRVAGIGKGIVTDYRNIIEIVKR